MTTSEQINELAAALAKAQGEMKPAVKDSTNPHFKSSYADLAACWDACRAPLTKHGLSVVQGASADAERVTVTTLLLHTSGQWVQDALTSAARDAGAQSVGSAITYGRRYGLCAMVGIAPEDDDAEGATARHFSDRPVNMPAAVPVLPSVSGVGTAPKIPARMQVRTPARGAMPIEEPPPLTDKDIPF